MTHVSVIDVGCKEYVGSCEAVYITTQRCIVSAGIIYDIYIFIYLFVFIMKIIIYISYIIYNTTYIYIYIYILCFKNIYICDICK